MTDHCACGRNSVGVCQLCGQPVCGRHLWDAEPSGKGLQHEVAHTIEIRGEPHVFHARQEAVSALRASDAAYHLGCVKEAVDSAGLRAIRPDLKTLPDDDIGLMMCDVRREHADYGLDEPDRRRIWVAAYNRTRRSFVADEHVARRLAATCHAWVRDRYKGAGFDRDGNWEMVRVVRSTMLVRGASGNDEVPADYDDWIVTPRGELMERSAKPAGLFGTKRRQTLVPLARDDRLLELLTKCAASGGTQYITRRPDFRS